MSYFLWRVKEDLIYVLVSLNEQKYSIATTHLGEDQGKKSPTNEWLLFPYWKICDGFAIYGIASAAGETTSQKRWPSVLFLKYVADYLLLWLLSHPLAPPRLDLAKDQKISQYVSCEQFNHNPHVKMTKGPRCPGETLPHLTSQGMMDVSHGCVKVVLGGLGEWEGWFPLR